jgi:hypothetical protein
MGVIGRKAGHDKKKSKKPGIAPRVLDGGLSDRNEFRNMALVRLALRKVGQSGVAE